MSKSKSNAVANSPPEGMYLDPPRNKWKIGAQIGSGACGSVHQLMRCSSSDNSGSSSCWAVKIAVLPPVSASATLTKRKKKKSAVEINADLLNYENTMYRNVLTDLCGNMVPDVPSGSGCPVGFGDLEGYRFIVMERMKSPLSSIIPLIYKKAMKLSDSSQQSSSSVNSRKSRNRRTPSQPSKSIPTIPLGNIASRLITLIENIHDLNIVFVDVKPENFMVATSPTTGSSSSKNEDRVEDCIRMIDFGLIESYIDVTIRKSNKHRIDEENGSIAGTPLYASRNAMKGHTVSRRDDLEACGYVICETMLQVMEYASSGGNEVGVKEGLLPWSKGTSDEHVLRLKKEALSNEDDGAFWNSLSIGEGNKKYAAGIMKVYFDVITKMGYNEAPDYDNLRNILGELKLSLVNKEYNNSASDEQKDEQMMCDNYSARRTKGDSKSRKQVRHDSTQNVTKSNQDISDDCSEDDEDYDRTDKVNGQIREEASDGDSSRYSDDRRNHKRTTRVSARCRPLDTSSTCIAAKKTKPAANTTTTTITTTVTELQPPQKRKTRSSAHMALLSIDGIGGVQNPSTNKDRERIRKNKVLKQRKKRVTVVERVTTTVEVIDDSDDEDEEDDQFLDVGEFEEDQAGQPPTVADHHCQEEEEEEDSNGDDMEMMTTNDEYEVDEGTFLSCHTPRNASNELDKDVTIPMEIDITNEDEKENCVNTIPSNEVRSRSDIETASLSSIQKGASMQKRSTDGAEDNKNKYVLKLVCIEGPHEGETVEVEDTVTFGQNPRGKNPFKLEKDGEASVLHAKTILTKSGKGKKVVLSIRVTDLKSTNGTYVNGKIIPVGGSRQAFIGNSIQFGDCIFKIKKI